MTEQHTLMVVHAHPDDEVFGTGGIIAKYAAAGDRVVVVYATRGEVGEMYHPELDEAEAMKRLGEIREEECREACALLGVTDIFFLGYRDSGMKDTEPNAHPEAFANADLDEAVQRLMDIMRQTEPEVVVTYNENGGYGHPDHVMTNRVTTEAFKRAQRETWGPQKLYYGASSREAFRAYVLGLERYGLAIPWLKEDFNFDDYGMPESEITALIDISPYAPLKKQVLAVHRTQIKSDFFYLTIPDDAMRELQGREFFVRVFPPPSGDQETDLFAGITSQTPVA